MFFNEIAKFLYTKDGIQIVIRRPRLINCIESVLQPFHEHALIFIGYDFSRVRKAVFTQNCYCVTLKTTDLKEKLFTFTDGIKLIIVFPKKQR